MAQSARRLMAKSFATLFLLLTSQAFAASGITYHGKLLLSDGVTPVTSATTYFRMQIKSPTNCILWQEEQMKNLSTSNGVFSVTINDTTEPTLVPNALAFSLERVFSNRSTFTGLTGCDAGVVYTPSADDGRVLQVSFKENIGDPWDDFPVTKINYVPFSLNSQQLAGFSASEFLKIDPASTYTTLTAANVDTLEDLIAGTNTQYLRPATTFAGDITGTYSATVVERIRGTNVVATAPTSGQVLKFDGTNWSPAADDTGAAAADSSYTVKGQVQINTDLATSGLFIASGVLALPNVITAGGPIGGVSTIPVITYDQKGRLTAVTTATVDDTTKLPLAGGTMTGAINMGTQNITNATSVAATNFSGRNLVLNDNDTNTVTIRTPSDISANYILELPADDGTSGQVLTTDGSGVLSWASGASGDITDVVAGAGLVTGGSSGSVTLDVAAGTGIVVGANDVAVDAGLGSNKVPMVGGTALGANGVVVANGTATALTSLNCTLNQVIKFDASGFATCGADSGGATSSGTAGHVQFSDGSGGLSSDSSELFWDSTNHRLGIGTATPSVELDVHGDLNVQVGGINVNKAGGDTYTGTGATAYPTSMIMLGNNTSGTGQSSIMSFRVRNSGATDQYAHIGAVADPAYPAIVFGQQSGAAAYTERMRIAPGGNVGISNTNPANAKLEIGTAGSSLGTMRLAGSTSGYVQIQPSAAAGSYTLTLPTDDGTSGQVLSTDGAGVLSWTTVPSSGGTFLAADGTVGAPGFAFSSDTDTGIYRHGANHIAISAGGSRIFDANMGGVAVQGTYGQSIWNASTYSSTGATASPSIYTINTSNTNNTNSSYNTLQLAAMNSSSNQQYAYLGVVSNAGAGVYSPEIVIGQQTGAATYAERVRIDSSGNVGIGSTSPGALLQLGTAGTSLGTMRMTGSTSGYVQIQPAAAAGSYTLTLPTDDGTSGQVLSTDGSGALSWATAPTNGGTFLAADGTVSAPGFAFNSDTNTGIWRATTDTMAFSTAGSERIRIDAAGDVGIGSTNPTSTLHVAKTVTAPDGNAVSYVGATIDPLANVTGGNYAKGFQVDTWLNAHAAEFQNWNNYGVEFNLYADQWGANTIGSAVGIKSTTYNTGDNTVAELIGQDLEVAKMGNGDVPNLIAIDSSTINNSATGSVSNAKGINLAITNTGTMTTAIGINIDMTNSGTITTGYGIYLDNIHGTTQYSIFANDSGAPSRFAAGVGIGTSGAPTTKLDVVDSQATNTVALFNNSNTGTDADGIAIRIGPTSNPGTSNDFIQFQDGDGTVIGQIEGNGSGATAYNTASDRRLKDNIQNTHFNIFDLLKIKVRDYNYKTSTIQTTGFIAQELYEVFPAAVSKPEDESKENWGVDYGKVTPLLVKSVQDLYGMCKVTDAKVEKQSRQIASLESENAELKARIDRTEKENADIKARLDRIEKMLKMK